MRPAQEVELLALTYFVLNLQTHQAERPGRIRDYIPLYDFDVDVRCNVAAKSFSVDVRASPDPSIHQG